MSEPQLAIIVTVGSIVLWMAFIHWRAVTNREDIADLSMRTRALQDQVNQLRREVRER
jgi:hypothetical protein